MSYTHNPPVIVSSRLLGKINRMDPQFWRLMQVTAIQTHTTLDDGSFDFILHAAENEIIYAHREARELRYQARKLLLMAQAIERKHDKMMMSAAGRKRLRQEERLAEMEDEDWVD